MKVEPAPKKIRQISWNQLHVQQFSVSIFFMMHMGPDYTANKEQLVSIGNSIDRTR